MKNRIYSNFLEFISEAANSKDTTKLQDSFQKGIGSYALSSDSRTYSSEEVRPSQKGEIGLEQLARFLNISPVKSPQLGDHPDFTNLRNLPIGQFEKHYIASMFIDVKGSTNLNRKYSQEQIYYIIQSIVLAATHTCSLFGGHIQRLQYDGVFIYFGGKSKDKNKSIDEAIKAASFFSYFMKYELNEIFTELGIDSIHSRIGLDFGDDHEVQWVIFGTQNCNELTTNSLHTSLAPKMQSYAESNGIMIGHNVKSRLNGNAIYCDFIRNDIGNVDTNKRYIYQDPNKNFYYSQYKFNWISYLKNSFYFIKTDDKGNIYIDYDSDPNLITEEQKRIQRLSEKANMSLMGNSFLDNNGKINTENRGVSIQPNRNYYENE
jgi:adenylate cyclase